MELNFGKLGFGFLRLPHTDPNDISTVDVEETKKMVDLFLSRGFRYFDTAYTYLRYKAEDVLRQVLVERYPRDSYMIASKLPCGALRKGKTAQGIFQGQLTKCGVDYFDVYLLHGLDAEDAVYAQEQGCFEFLKSLKETGKARYIGFSFHDTAEALDAILTRHPEVDVVQIQLNYLDWDHEIIQSGACYDVCRKHGKPIIVMEPVKGGTLAKLPEQAAALLDGESPARRAIRFAASQSGVAVVLSGMSDMAQMEDNTACMQDFQPLTKRENQVLQQVKKIVREAVPIACTGCAYCLEGCPINLPIPQYFSLYNAQALDGWQANAKERYQKLAKTFPAAQACIRCGSCEKLCPQKLPIRQNLKLVSETFDK